MWPDLKFPPINLYNVWARKAMANYHAAQQDPTLWDPSIDGRVKMITIYGKPNCPYCDMAKKLCEINSIPYIYVDIVEERIDAASLGELLGRPVRTVPQICSDEQYIGGYAELQKHLQAA